MALLSSLCREIEALKPVRGIYKSYLKIIYMCKRAADEFGRWVDLVVSVQSICKSIPTKLKAKIQLDDVCSAFPVLSDHD
jgi:hypothetical protein